MRFIPLTNSRFKAIVDDEDYDRVMALNANWAVVSKDGKPTGIRTSTQPRISLHRFIHRLADYERNLVDHIYHDIFDNRKKFTRISSYSNNSINRLPNKGYKYKGVTKIRRKWGIKILYIARVCKNGERYHLGFFDTAVEAAEAYDKKVLELFGEFAVLNFKSC